MKIEIKDVDVDELGRFLTDLLSDTLNSQGITQENVDAANKYLFFERDEIELGLRDGILEYWIK